MQSYGKKALVLNGTSPSFDVGSGYEYIRIINESGYDCEANLTGMGTCSIPPWQLLDIPVINARTGNNMLTGQVSITPFNSSNIDPTIFPSAYVKVNAFYPGELPAPQNVALTRIATVPNTVKTNVSTANNVQNSLQPVGTSFLTAFDGTNTVASFSGLNNGVLQLGNDGSGPNIDNGFLEINTPNPLTGTPPTGTGNVKLYMPIGGSTFAVGGQIFKMIMLIFTNYKNTSASKWTMVPPTAFTTAFMQILSDNPSIEFLSGGIAQQFNQFSAAGTFTSPTNTLGMTFGSGIAAFDTLRFAASDATTHNGIALIFGI